MGLVAQAPAELDTCNDCSNCTCCDTKLKCCKKDSCQTSQELPNDNVGNTFYVDRDCACCAKSVNDLDLSINSWLEVGEEATQGTDNVSNEMPRCTDVQEGYSKEQVWCSQEDEAFEDNILFAWLKAGCSTIERGVLSLGGGHG